MAIILPKLYSQDVAQPVTVRHGGGLLFTGNAASDTIMVTLYKDGAAYSPGGSVALKCIRADGVTVAVDGSISGNVATATLTANCCTVPGPLAVVMQITSGGTVGAVFAAVYNVEQSATGTVVAADNMLDDIDALIAEIQAAVESIPLDYSALNAYAHAIGNMTVGPGTETDVGGTFTAGRIDKSTGYESSTKYAYSEVFERTDAQFYWDDETYTVTFCYYDTADADPTQTARTALASWYTDAPQAAPAKTGHHYVSAEFKRKDSGDITASACRLYTVSSEKAPIVQAVEPLKPAYVDASAASGGTGTSAAPFNAIADAIATGAETIFVKAGTYAPFSAANRTRPLRICLWDMGTYVKGDKDIGKIKVSFSGQTSGIVIHDCSDVRLSDIEVSGSNEANNRYCFRLYNIQHLELVRCYAHDNTTVSSATPPVVTSNTYSGFSLINVNGVVRDCVAYNIGLDGFNIHGFGDTQFINCVAYDCGDDGISHHDACTGLILGGEYYQCGKAGVASPYYDARVDVINVYSHDNLYGIYSAGDDKDGVIRIPAGRLTGCALKNNATKDVYLSRGTYTAWGNLYDTLQTAQGATLTEIDIAATDDGNGNITIA